MYPRLSDSGGGGDAGLIDPILSCIISDGGGGTIPTLSETTKGKMVLTQKTQ